MQQPSEDETSPPLERLAPRALHLFRLRMLVRTVLYALVASSLGLGLLLAGRLAFLGPVLGAFLLLLLGLLVWYPRRAWQRWGYAVREHDLLIQSGVLVHRRVSIPAGRIQHVDIDQGPFERLLGLARVQVFTASGGGADGVIPGLAPEVADALRERLVRREGEDVV